VVIVLTYSRYKQKNIFGNRSLAPGHLRSRARGAVAELDEPSAKGWTLVME
jgi:hypothetical protein